MRCVPQLVLPFSKTDSHWGGHAGALCCLGLGEAKATAAVPQGPRKASWGSHVVVDEFEVECGHALRCCREWLAVST